MKRTGVILCLAALIVMITASVCFGAQSLEITDTYPADGQDNTTIENMCVKIWLNNEMGNEKSEKANEDCFEITDNKGKKVPTRVFYNPEDPKQIMVLADTTKNLNIKDNTEYTLTISGDLTDNDGNTLGHEQTVTFKTLNQSQSTQIYMLMMVVMFGGMFFFTSRQMKKQREKESEGQKVKEEPFNPYKEAKRTGKSVEEVMAAHEKEEAKKAAKEARKAARHNADEEEEFEEEDNGNFKVKNRDRFPQAAAPISPAEKLLPKRKKLKKRDWRAEERQTPKRRRKNNE